MLNFFVENVKRPISEKRTVYMIIINYKLQYGCEYQIIYRIHPYFGLSIAQLQSRKSLSALYCSTCLAQYSVLLLIPFVKRITPQNFKTSVMKTGCQKCSMSNLLFSLHCRNKQIYNRDQCHYLLVQNEGEKKRTSRH